MRESVIKRLIKLVEESNIEELEVSRWGRRVRISKRAQASLGNNPEVAVSSAEPSARDAKAANMVAIESPMVGTFYRSPAPSAEPYVKVGQTIAKGTVVCIVEAMKLMNEIESDVSGRIVDILAVDAQPVEFGQPLFFVEPS